MVAHGGVMLLMEKEEESGSEGLSVGGKRLRLPS